MPLDCCGFPLGGSPVLASPLDGSVGIRLPSLATEWQLQPQSDGSIVLARQISGGGYATRATFYSSNANNYSLAVPSNISCDTIQAASYFRLGTNYASPTFLLVDNTQCIGISSARVIGWGANLEGGDALLGRAGPATLAINSAPIATMGAPSYSEFG